MPAIMLMNIYRVNINSGTRNQNLKKHKQNQPNTNIMAPIFKKCTRMKPLLAVGNAPRTAAAFHRKQLADKPTFVLRGGSN